MRLVYLALGWVAGILLAAITPALIPLFRVVLLSAVVLALWFGWDTRYRWLLLASLAFALAGYRFAFVPQTSDIARYNGQNVTLQGQVVAPPDRRDDRVQVRVQVEQVTAATGAFYSEGLVLVSAPRVSDVAYGDVIRATGPLMTPAQFDTFSYADYLARSGVFSVMRGAALEIVQTDGGTPFMRNLLHLKEQVRQNIALALPEPQAGLLTGILLGNERGISPELAEDFSRVGASHIIAISGFNMVIVAGLVMGLLGQTPLGRGWKGGLSVLVLAIYTVFVGANAAVVRAALMSSLLIIAPLLRRKTFLPASLACVVIAMSLHNPLVLWDLSFQLSFFAVLGLALFTEPLTRRFDALLERLLPAGWAQTTGRFLNEPLIVTLAALALTLPLTVLYFQRLSLLALLVNVLIVPVQSYLLIVGGLAALLSLVVPGVAQLVFWLDMVLLSWSIAVVRFFADWSFADVELTLDPRLIAGFYAVIMGGAIVQATRPRWLLRVGSLIRRRPVLNAILFSGGALLLLLLAIGVSRPDGRLHVWFLDVGHSNAVLIQTPGGAQILVDGGRYPSRLLTAIGDRLPFYDRELELVVITHTDDFDTAALPALFSRYRAGAVLVNGQMTQSDTADALREAIAPFEVVEARSGYTIELDDGVQLEVLNPPQAPAFGAPPGDGVLLLRLSYGEVSFLLTSDLSRAAQTGLLDRGVWPLADVLQLPQHGTARSLSESFLEAVQPQVLVLQSDSTNRRGDPDTSTLALLDASLPLFRTDEQGVLHLWTDGQMLWVQPDQPGTTVSPAGGTGTDADSR